MVFYFFSCDVAMSFPGSGLETTYRNNLREVAKMLQTNHQDKYMVRAFSLSVRRLKCQGFDDFSPQLISFDFGELWIN